MLAITGASGALGGQVARAVADLEPRLLVRDAARAPQLGLPVHVATYDDAAAVTAALEGVDTVLMVSAHEGVDRVAEHRAFVGAAARAGVRHLVYTSFAAAAPEATFTLGRDHYQTEQLIRDSGLEHTFLRDNFYLDVLPLFADADGVLRGPAAEGRVAAVARADVADVAAAVLRDPAPHAGVTYTLIGPEALTLGEAAARIDLATGRALRFRAETLEEAYASRRAAYPDAADWQLDASVSTYVAIADGSCEVVTDDVVRVSGHPPRSLEDVLETAG